MEYIPRIYDKLLKEKLKLYGAILIIGPKWCGKSTTANQIAKSTLELQNPRTKKNNLEIAKSRPDLLLEGEKPRLIDEWQDAPALWDAIRYDVDKTGLKNQYILTGSVTPREDEAMHTGTGRIVRILMRPMSLYESKDSTGEVSLKSLFEKVKDIKGTSNKEYENIAYLCARGGWPGSLDVSKKGAISIARDYLESLIANDIKTIDNVNRNTNRLRTILRSLARNTCTTASIGTIREDTSYDNGKISEKTITDYINALSKLYVIDDVEAWCPKLRSKTTIRTTSKRCFIDPSIALAALRSSDKDLLKDFNTFGFIFESLCLRDLKIYAQALDGDVFYYRDKNDLECDAIVHLKDGRWGAIEIKLGNEEAIELAAENLKKLTNIIDVKAMNEPSFLMVLTAGKYSYRREDGIYVVSIATLKD